MLRRCQHDVRLLEGEGSDDEEGEDLCDCDFSLAYGGRILLSGAKLRLKKGGRYGLCGPNGAGKTTLMKAIANGQVDGFPDRSEVLTVYVAHDIQAQEEDPVVVDYLASDPLIKQKGLGAEACRAALQDIGFDASRLALTISTLSGVCLRSAMTQVCMAPQQRSESASPLGPCRSAHVSPSYRRLPDPLHAPAPGVQA